MVLAGVINELIYGTQFLGPMIDDVVYLSEFSHLEVDIYVRPFNADSFSNGATG